nr:amidohydrolase [Marinicella sp. NBU2979]
MTVAAVQADIQWLDKTANFAALEALIVAYFRDHDALDLLLLPETFSTGFCTHDPMVKEPADGGDDLVWLKHMAAQHHCVMAGTVLVAAGDKKANRFYWVRPDGRVEFYDKRHLFRLGNEGDYVAQGMDRKVFEINGFRILPQVCYDLRFPVFSRNRQDYDLLVNVANWPAARRHVWDTLLKARAMENQAYVIGVNRVGSDGSGVAHSGGTCVLDFVGEPMVAASDNQVQIISTTLDIAKLDQFKQSFPAYLDADEFELK